MSTSRLTFRIRDWLFSDKGLTRKAYLNSLARLLDYGARLLVGFLVTPLLVVGLGDSLYGIWLVLDRMTGYLSAASGRPTQALKWTLAKQQSSDDYEAKRRNVGAALSVWLLFLPLLAALGGTIVWLAPHWLSIADEHLAIVRIAAALLVTKLIMTTLVAVPASVLEGENLGYKRMGVSAGVVFVGGGLTALALYLGGGLVGVAMAALATILLNGAVYLFVARGHVPWFGIARPARGDTRQFMGLSIWFLLWNMVTRIMRASDVVLLGILASPQLVAVYSLTKYLPEVLTNSIGIMVLGTNPGLGGILGKGDHQKAARVRGEIMLLSWLLITVAGAAILLWNQAFLRLWVGTEFYAGPLATLAMVAVIAQFTLIRNDATTIDLTLDLRRKVLLGLASAGLSVGLAVFLVGWLNKGIVGMCAGFLVGRLLLSIAYPVMVGRIVHISPWSQLRRVWRPALTTVLLFGGILAMNFAPAVQAQVDAVSWSGLVLALMFTLAVVGTMSIAIGLSREQQTMVFRRFQMVMNKASG